MVTKWPTGRISATLKKIEEFMTPTDGGREKLSRLVDSVPPDKGYEVLDGELTHK